MKLFLEDEISRLALKIKDLRRAYTIETRAIEKLRLQVEMTDLIIKREELESLQKLSLNSSGFFKGVFNRLNQKKIDMPPGSKYSIIGKLIFTKKSYERVIEPAITMMQEEYFEAYSQKRFAMARWIRFRFFFIFLQIVGMNLPLISSLLELKEKFTSK